MKLIIDSELRDSLAAYLRSRPLGEVYAGYVELMNLPAMPEPETKRED